jgi:hypothetical protein
MMKTLFAKARYSFADLQESAHQTKRGSGGHRRLLKYLMGDREL